ncbi:hypothetical protein DEJ13_02735 [Curtobacterium sp. MCLR17_007]|uniref:hypothetical protein n=1 Tax=Curtobacterium sp. MCLR17_007 TaxID=2175648 RepID=UPI000DA92D06|nr:hypothetical protein [Curtobacterium sp. MCLR17_007]WIB60765.1 hypothetical protein DEJ13_02735 [Curtobacterium sp. MCLR17_007]
MIYCTVVAQNYLPQALALYESIRRVEPDKELVILVVDGDRRDLETGRPGLRIATTEILGLSRRDVLELAAIYDVVEFSTSVKPLFFKALLAESERVAYLDPDMMVVTPLQELPDLLDAHGVVLTPHFLEPIPEAIDHITEGHDLTVGIFNLGFCAVGRSAVPFLEWWWGHLRRECLIYPLLGVFVDQKWVDVGATYFSAHALRHSGYNVGPWNLHERHFTSNGERFEMDSSGDELRLLHFSGFDPADPEAISVRLSVDLRGVGADFPALSELSRQYAANVIAAQAVLGRSQQYGFSADAQGEPLTKRTRRAYRKQLLEMPSGARMPSPFIPTEVSRFRRWKRRALVTRIGVTASDAAIAAKYALPDEFALVKKRVPGFATLRRRLLQAGRVRG